MFICNISVFSFFTCFFENLTLKFQTGRESATVVFIPIIEGIKNVTVHF